MASATIIFWKTTSAVCTDTCITITSHTVNCKGRINMEIASSSPLGWATTILFMPYTDWDVACREQMNVNYITEIPTEQVMSKCIYTLNWRMSTSASLQDKYKASFFSLLFRKPKEQETDRNMVYTLVCTCSASSSHFETAETHSMQNLTLLYSADSRSDFHTCKMAAVIAQSTVSAVILGALLH